jgi:hypothetical protein
MDRLRNRPIQRLYDFIWKVILRTISLGKTWIDREIVRFNDLNRDFDNTEHDY